MRRSHVQDAFHPATQCPSSGPHRHSQTPARQQQENPSHDRSSHPANVLPAPSPFTSMPPQGEIHARLPVAMGLRSCLRRRGSMLATYPVSNDENAAHWPNRQRHYGASDRTAQRVGSHVLPVLHPVLHPGTARTGCRAGHAVRMTGRGGEASSSCARTPPYTPPCPPGARSWTKCVFVLVRGRG